MKKLILLILLLSFIIKAQDVTIGTQTWTSKNLDESKFRNGEAIPLAKTNAEWETAGRNKQPAWCYYENKEEKGTTYGKLYNWYAVNDPRGLAPNGYHIPTDEEWATLITYLGGSSIAGGKMKNTSGWKSNGYGTNESGFAGLPGGFRWFNGGFGYSIGNDGEWWSSSEDGTTNPSNGNLYALSIRLYNHDGSAGRCSYGWEAFGSKGKGFSVRCLRD